MRVYLYETVSVSISAQKSLEEMLAYYVMMQGNEEWTFSCVNVLCVGRGVMSQSRYHSRYFVRYVENC